MKTATKYEMRAGEMNHSIEGNKWPRLTKVYSGIDFFNGFKGLFLIKISMLNNSSFKYVQKEQKVAVHHF